MTWQSEFKNEFSWSKSRDALFNTCLRAYYYHYYGSWNGWQPDVPPDVRELYIMKNLETIPMLIGRVVHEVLEAVVGAMRRGWELPVEQAIDMGLDPLHDDFEDSRKGLYRSQPKKLLGLQDHYYGIAISEESFQQAMATMKECITSFHNTHTYRRMTKFGPSSIMEFEELKSMILAGTKVWVKLDLMARDLDDTVVVVDWKTGPTPAAEDAELQLRIYGIYAVETYGLAADQLLAVEENLRLRERHVYPLDEAILDEAREDIKRSVQQMQGLLRNPDGNVAFVQDFPMTDNLGLCTYCRFRRACNRE